MRRLCARTPASTVWMIWQRHLEERNTPSFNLQSATRLAYWFSENGCEPLRETWDGCYLKQDKPQRTWMPTPPGEPRHVARMSFALAQRIWSRGTELGWWGRGSKVCSPMAGEGTELLASRLQGAEVYGIEIEPRHYARMVEHFSRMDDRLCRNGLEIEENRIAGWFAHCGDATQDWPSEIRDMDAVIFSPTYEWGLRNSNEGPQAVGIKGSTIEERRAKRIELGYGDTPGQIGRLTRDRWRAAMRTVYRRAYEATKPGGHLVVVTKDIRKAWVIYPVSFLSFLDARMSGWSEPVALFKATGADRSMFARLNNQKYIDNGHPECVINWEDIIVLRKPMVDSV